MGERSNAISLARCKSASVRVFRAGAATLIERSRVIIGLSATHPTFAKLPKVVLLKFSRDIHYQEGVWMKLSLGLKQTIGWPTARKMREADMRRLLIGACRVDSAPRCSTRLLTEFAPHYCCQLGNVGLTH